MKDLGEEVSDERVKEVFFRPEQDRRETRRKEPDRRKSARYMALRTIVFSGVNIHQAKKQIAAIRSLY